MLNAFIHIMVKQKYASRAALVVHKCAK